MDPTTTETTPRVSDASAQRQGGRAQAVLLLAGSCMPVLGSVLLAPVLPSMTQAFAGTPGVDILVPLVLTIPALIIALLAPFAGMVADRIGRKSLLLIAMVVYSVFGTMPLWLDSLGLIALSRVGVGVAEAAIMTVCTTLIADYFIGRQRDKHLGMQVLVASLSATAFFALGGALGNHDWRTPFWLYISAVIIAIPMTFLLWEPAKNVRKAEKTGVPWTQIAAPSLVTLFGGIVFYALIVHLPYVLTDLGVTNVGVIGAGTALASLATATGAFCFRYAASLGPFKLLSTSFAMAAVGLVVICFAASVPMALVGAVITSAGTGLLLPSLLTWAVSGLTLEQRGRGTGVWTGSLYIDQFISPIVLGVAAAAIGGLPFALGALGALCAIAAVIGVVVRPRRRVASA